MAPNGIPHLQLPILTPLEPLTSGTNLPHVSPEELSPTELSPKPPPTPTTTLDASTTPPQSPGRPTSMRRFLSRVSLNSSYTTNEEDDRASVLSNPLSPTVSVMSRDSKRRASGTGKKSSWWKKSKDKKEEKAQQKSMPPPPPPPSHVVVASQVSSTHFDERYPETSPQATTKRTVQSIAPPPRLPDDLFGNGFSSLDSDMFKNFK